MQAPARALGELSVEIAEVLGVDPAVLALPQVEDDVLGGREEVPAVGVEADGHQDLLSEEEHEQVRVVRHLRKQGAEAEGEVRAPKVAAPWP